MNDLELYFQFRCEKGLAKRGLAGKQEYAERLEYEIQTIKSMGYVGYFLIVSDMLCWALAQGIPVGPGRGSAAGSLVAYVLEITHLDPIRYGLIFERFLNPDRVSMPDVDMDFCEIRRGEVIDYVVQKYGAERVAHIGTYGTMKAKASIRDAGRTLGHEYQLCDKLAKMTLEPIEGKNQSLNTCYEKVPELKGARFGEAGPAKQILQWAERVENRIRAFGTHASGVVISQGPITEMIPLYPGKDGKPTTQFEMNTVEECGLIKFDFLGLRALTTIDRCVKSVAKRHGITIDPLKIPVDDADVYKMLQAGDVLGVFQMEGSSGIRDLVLQIRPTCLEDLSTIVAVYRPGPLSSEMLQHYLKVRAGEASPQYIVPELEPILGETDGMLIYQEQILDICKQLSGYTMGEADLMRRAVGKKKEKEMAAQEVKFKAGLSEFGISTDDANRVWDDIKSFAAYGFNKAHSACYAYIGYQMAWLKYHYPLEFLVACLISDSDEVDKVIQYISYCKEKDIAVHGPCINKSEYKFSVSEDGKSIRFGLGAIKNLGKPVQDIIRERKENGPFVNILDFASRVDLSKVNRRKLESLVLSGAFDTVGGHNRSSMMHAIDNILNHKDEKKRYEKKLETFNNRKVKYEQRLKDIQAWEELSKEDRKGVKKPGRMKAPEPPEEPSEAEVPDKIDMSIQDILVKEKELLGFYISGHPLDNVTEYSPFTIDRIKDEGKANQKVQLIAIPSYVKEFTTKKAKQKMGDVVLEDKTGTIQAAVFAKTWAKSKAIIDPFMPARYAATIDVTEADEKKVVKLKVLSVQVLASVKEYQNRAINIAVPMHLGKAAAGVIRASAGTTFQVSLTVVSERGHKFEVGTFRCGGKQTDLEQQIKEL